MTRRDGLAFVGGVVLSAVLLPAGHAVPPSPAAMTARHPEDDPRARFSPARAAACLATARHHLRDHDAVFADLERFVGDAEGSSFAELRGRHRLQVSGYHADVGIPPDVLSRFDGGWEGIWAGAPARHVWLSLSIDVQLVVIRDGDVVQRAVNLVDRTGTMCGIVLRPGGEQLHEGRVFPEGDHGPAYLRWLTPDSVYRERVEDAGGRRRYVIESERLDGDAFRPHVGAAYRPFRMTFAGA